MSLPAEPARRAPRSRLELFRVFTRLALQGFGGVLPVAQHHLVERERWMTADEFVECLSVGQVLPGPNVCNVALMVGDRHFGLGGALAALAGILAAPLLVVVALAALYAQLAQIPLVVDMLRGMGAVAAGLVIATALKLARTLPRQRLGWKLGGAIALATFGAVGLARWPMLGVVFGLGGASVALAAWWGAPAMTMADAFGLFGHCLLLSLLAIGGAIAVAPDLHRYVVLERGWLSDAQFTDSIALAQAAPGPNLLFIAVVGWNAGGWLGTVAAMTGVLIPSTTVALAATRWGMRRDDHPFVAAFKTGMAPVTIGLVGASGWVLTEPFRLQPASWALIALTVWGSLTQRLSPMLLIGIGAVAGALVGAVPALSGR